MLVSQGESWGQPAAPRGWRKGRDEMWREAKRGEQPPERGFLVLRVHLLPAVDQALLHGGDSLLLLDPLLDLGDLAGSVWSAGPCPLRESGHARGVQRNARTL